MKIKNIIWILIILVNISFKVNAQSAIEAGEDKTITCGDSVQLNAEPLWQILDSIANINVLASLFFTDNLTGYAVGYNGSIIKTIDGATNWITQTSGTINYLYSVYFADVDTGFTVGIYGTILKTTDGGDNWISKTSGTLITLKSVFFTDVYTGYVVGDSGTILKTINGGTSWASQTSGTLQNLNSVYYTNDSTGYAVGDAGTILKTSDGGTIWNTQSSGTTNNLKSINFVNANIGYAVGDDGTILKTSNGGIIWTILSSGTTFNLNSVYFSDANSGYAVGNSSTILRTNDGGINWTSLPTYTNNDLYSVYFPNANTVYATGFAFNSYFTIFYKSTTPSSYVWSPANGLSATNIAKPMASPTSSTKYIVSAIENGFTAIDSITVVVNPLIVEAGSDKTVICGGTVQLDSITSNHTGSAMLTYNWLPAPGLNNSSIPNPTATVVDNTQYFATVTSSNGCIATDSVTIFADPLIIYVDNASTTCGNAVILNTTNNYTGTETLTYNWQPTTGLNASNVPAPTATPGSETTYTVTVSTPMGCIATNQATVSLGPLTAQEICYVEFDTSTTKNSINWSSALPANIDSVYIYNEVSTNVWNLIETVPVSQSEFIDVNSNPFNQSYSYRISVKDTCGLVTDFSAVHTTITLLSAYDQGTNTYGFTWSSYQGIPVSNYYIFGISTTTGSATLIGSVLGNQNFYNYTNPCPVYVKYFVGFNTPSCNSKTNHLVLSNFVQAATGIAETASINNMVSISPNPVIDNLQIQTALQVKKVEITDVTGRLLYTTSAKTIDCSSFAKGVYFVKVETNNGIASKKFIRQ